MGVPLATDRETGWPRRLGSWWRMATGGYEGTLTVITKHYLSRRLQHDAERDM